LFAFFITKKNTAVSSISHFPNNFLVGHIPDLSAPEFVQAIGVNELTHMHWPEFVDLSQMICELTANNTENLYAVYNEKVNQQKNEFVFLDDLVVNGRICGCLSPTYRNRNPLKYGLDNRAIILILCDISTCTNYLFYNDEPTAEHCTSKSVKTVRSETIPQNCINSMQIQLFPRSFVQTNYQNTLSISKVLYGKLQRIPCAGNSEYSSSSQSSSAMSLDQFCQLSISAPSLTPPDSLMESPTATYQQDSEKDWYQQTSAMPRPNYMSPQLNGELLLQQASPPMIYRPAATSFLPSPTICAPPPQYVYQHQQPHVQLITSSNEQQYFNIPFLQRLPYYEQPNNGYSVAFPINQ
jgi:hypothetical protein